MSMASNISPRLFAPLNDARPSSDLPLLRGIVFDVDGTLCEPQTYMFAQMRSVLGISKEIDILKHIYALPTPAAQKAAMEAVAQIERTAMTAQIAQPGLAALMAYLDNRGIRKAICSRNFDAPVAHLLEKFLAGSLFDPILTRSFLPPKPDPAGILHIAKSWGLVKASGPRAESSEGSAEQGEIVADASGLIMVGDSADDMMAGRRAGAATVLVASAANKHLQTHEDTDLVISCLDELIEVLDKGFVGCHVHDATI